MDFRPPATPFIGRRSELALLGDVLRRPDTRLVTLVGPAGVGKTRLALELAARFEVPAHTEVLVAALASVSDPAGVVPAILRQIGAADTGARDPVAQLTDTLRARCALLVLDNVEQVVEAAPDLVKVLDACGDLRVVATSRRPLRVQPEQVVIVGPLPTPEPDDLSTPLLLETDAVALLIARMRAADAAFTPSTEMAPALATICRRLDGLPLAIELVAPRVRVLPVEAIADALQQRLPLLVRGPLDAPQRHRTMRNALVWSHDLLDERGARLLRHASLFPDGWSLEAARAVLPDLDEVDLLDAHEDLVMHSLVQRDANPDARFRMLHVVREFAAEELDASGERDVAERHHAEHFLAVAEGVASMSAADLGTALSRLERDRANLHAALGWAIAHHQADMAVRLCIALRMMWYVRGSLREGCALFEAALALPGSAMHVRARGLAEASTLTRQRGDFAGAGRLAGAAAQFARGLDDPGLLGYALLQQGFAAHLEEDATIARACLEESVTLARSTSDDLALGRALLHLGFVAMHCDNDQVAAGALQQEALALFRMLGNQRHIATALIAITQVELAHRQYARASEAVREAIAIVMALGDLPLLIYALHCAAAVLAAERHYEHALRLLGAIDRVELQTGAAPWPAMTRMSRGWLGAATQSVGARRAAALRRHGAELALADAVGLATADHQRAVDTLSKREQEIAELVTAGLTNRDIAARLFISERTVDGHVARVLAKLGFRARAQIAAWVTADGVGTDVGD